MKYFSMFSGIGGFEYGMDQSNVDFECVGYSEIDKYARSIYERNYPNHINYGDATKIRTEELPDFDFLVGGFPCQAFSIAGKRRGFNDTRGTLFFEIARVLEDKRPKYFLLENVKNLLSHDGGRTVKKIFEVLDELGYDVSWSIYNSKDYGVPQNRERIFIKGYSRRECGREVLHFRKNKEKNPATIIGRYVLNRSGYYHSKTNTLSTCLTANGQMSGGRKFILEKCVSSPRPHAGKTNGDVSPCLTANNYRSSTPILQFRNDNVEDEYLIRRLTPVECERLQGFPDDWTRYGADNELISDTQRYKCLGNAVTTTVITYIVNEWFG